MMSGGPMRNSFSRSFEKARRYIDEGLVNMQRRFGYSKGSALDTILIALRKRIIDFDEIIS
jgi:hypothetical protein